MTTNSFSSKAQIAVGGSKVELYRLRGTVAPSYFFRFFLKKRSRDNAEDSNGCLR